MRMLIAAAALAASALPALAAACGPHPAIVEMVTGTGQSLRATAVSGSGLLVEYFVDTDGRWSVVITGPGGPACIVDAGEAWEDIIPGSDA